MRTLSEDGMARTTGNADPQAFSAGEDVRQLFETLAVWERKGQRAPHKPLLALWAIGRCLRGEDRLAGYRTVDRDLRVLLKEFGPRRKSDHPEYPFWYLENDGVWELPDRERIPPAKGSHVPRRFLMDHDVAGGFPYAIYRTLRRDPVQAVEIAHALVAAHFPETRRGDVLAAVGLDPELRPADLAPADRRRRRDPRFRENVLAAYGHRCAVCRFAIRLPDRTLALDAAHIRWHRADGPDEVRNGMALCVMHHKLFDQGVFTVAPGDFTVIVARSVGGSGSREWLGRFDRRPLLVRPERHPPEAAHLRWHASEVFRDPEIAA